MVKRIVTAVIAASLFLPFVIFGNIPFTVFIYLLSSIALYELFIMRKIHITSFPGVVGLFLMWVLLIPSSHIMVLNNLTVTKIEFSLFAVLLLLSYTVVTKNRFSFDDAGFAMLAIFYIGIGFYYFIETRKLGLEYLIYGLIVVWTTDSGAYFIGKALGKRKLWPEISPNKTVEGFFGGIAAAIAAAVIFQAVTGIADSYIKIGLFTIVLSVCGQLGDLVESALKRQYNVKDSGSILPGHGGILDRFDSLLFVLPFLHFLFMIQ